MRKHLLHYLMAGILLFAGCGGGAGVTDAQKALSSIAHYISDNAGTPKMSDYWALHING